MADPTNDASDLELLLRRVIREEEPLKSSTRISTLGETATAASGHRQETSAHLRRLLELIRVELG